MSTTTTTVTEEISGLCPTDKIGIMGYYGPGSDGKPVPVDTARHTTVYGTGNQVGVVIRDLRKRPDVLKELSLDVNGFELHRWPSVEKDFTDKERVRSVYYDECVEVLKKVTGAYHVHIDTCLIRRDPFDKVLEHMAKDQTAEAVPAPLAPARHVHLDVSSQEGAAVGQRTLEVLPPDAQELLKDRPFAIVNIWRPIKTVQRDPLALIDARSVEDDELVAVPCFYISPNGAGSVDSEMFKVTHQKAQEHRWWYVREMEPDEILVFKQYDSRKGVAGRVPHSSFVDIEYENRGLPPRESIEIRAKVWF